MSPLHTPENADKLMFQPFNMYVGHNKKKKKTDLRNMCLCKIKGIIQFTMIKNKEKQAFPHIEKLSSVHFLLIGLNESAHHSNQQNNFK